MWVDEWAEWTPRRRTHATPPVIAWRSPRRFTLFYTAASETAVGMALYAEDGEVVYGDEEAGDHGSRIIMFDNTRALKEYPDGIGAVERVERAALGGFAVFCGPPGGS